MKCLILTFLIVTLILDVLITTGQSIFDQTITFKKCNCPHDEIETPSGCTKSNFTNILIWDHESATESLLDLKDYNNTVIQPLVCPQNFIKAVYYGFASFTTEGKLLVWPEPDTDLYCVENTIFFEEPKHKIEVCISKSKVPLCCGLDQVLVATWECLPIHSNKLPEAQSRWPEGFDYFVSNPSCEGKSFPSYEIITPMALHGLEFKKIISHFESLYNASYCIAIQEASSFEYVVKSCDYSCINASCVPMCCPSDQVYDIVTRSCLQYEKANEEDIRTLINGLSADLDHIPSRMTCAHKGVFTYDNNSVYEFLPNGSLFVTSHLIERTVILDTEEFCLGNFHFANDSIVPSGLQCLYGPKEDACSWRWTIVRVMLIISSLFILATLIVYLGVPDLRRRIQGACLIAELISLLISQVNLVVLQLNQNEFSTNGCLAAGVIELIFILASFFWLNVICYDVWSTFRKLRPFNENTMDKKVFAKYSLYGWGVPILIGIIVVIVEKMKVQLRPSFNLSLDEGCFFNNKDLASQWIYLYSIILLLLIINCGFFIHLAFHLLPHQMEQIKIFKRSGSASVSNATNTDKENMKLYLKLFVIMGLPWLLEIFSSFAMEKHQCFIWIIDLINLSRGIFIFFIFVFKKTTRDKIIAAWCSLPAREPPTTSVSERSRKTSLMSVSSWFPSSLRKVSKASLGSGTSGQMQQMGAINQTVQEIPEEEEDKEDQFDPVKRT